MAKPQVTKNWTITPNVRLAPFVSLNATMGWWLYQHKLAIVSAGWTVKFSSDGTTGPASAADTTDRWASQSSGPLTRATVAAAAQSWIVLQNVDGVQVLFAYQGASDDIARVSMSMAGEFTLAGTVTHQPTAGDEVIQTSAFSVIGSATSGDRILQLGCTTESWWSATLRQQAYAGAFLSVEKIDPAVGSAVLAKPYVVCKFNNLSAIETVGAPVGGVSSTATGLAAWFGIGTRVYTSGSFRAIRVGGGQITTPREPGNVAWSFQFGNAQNPLQGWSSIVLLPIHWFGERSTGCDGLLGSPIDWWQGWSYSSGAPIYGDLMGGLAPGDSQDDEPRSCWLVALGGGVVRPWLNAAANLYRA